MECRLFLDVVVAECASVFQLFTREDQTLLIWWNAFFVLETARFNMKIYKVTKPGSRLKTSSSSKVKMKLVTVVSSTRICVILLPVRKRTVLQTNLLEMPSSSAIGLFYSPASTVQVIMYSLQQVEKYRTPSCHVPLKITAHFKFKPLTHLLSVLSLQLLLTIDSTIDHRNSNMKNT
jgi:hypothetical protein